MTSDIPQYIGQYDPLYNPLESFLFRFHGESRGKNVEAHLKIVAQETYPLAKKHWKWPIYSWSSH